MVAKLWFSMNEILGRNHCKRIGQQANNRFTEEDVDASSETYPRADSSTHDVSVRGSIYHQPTRVAATNGRRAPGQHRSDFPGPLGHSRRQDLSPSRSRWLDGAGFHGQWIRFREKRAQELWIQQVE